MKITYWLPVFTALLLTACEPTPEVQKYSGAA